MATIQKRGKTYYISVSDGYDAKRRQIRKTVTWSPPPGMTPKQEEKEVNRQAVQFENQIKNGTFADGSIRFSEYSDMWMKTAQLAPATREQYTHLLKRINAAIGHIRLDKLQPHHLEAFYKNLRESGVNLNGSYAILKKLPEFMKEKKITVLKLSEMAGVSHTTVGTAARGGHIAVETAGKISAALSSGVTDIFDIYKNEASLSDKSIIHHHRLICAILSKAKREKVVSYNVASEYTTAPRIKKKEPRYLDDEQARVMVEKLLNEEDIRVKMAILLLVYGGMRRGELCGLSWPDIDFGNGLIHIMRASQYQPGVGTVEVPTKNESSVRAVKMPSLIFDVLKQYRTWWLQLKIKNGDRWKGSDQRLFVTAEGLPINPQTVNRWLSDFLEKNGLPQINPHGLRHTFATLQIAHGVDLKTLQRRGGWAQADTPMKIYAHAIKSASEAASDVLDDILTPAEQKKA